MGVSLQTRTSAIFSDYMTTQLLILFWSFYKISSTQFTYSIYMRIQHWAYEVCWVFFNCIFKNRFTAEWDGFGFHTRSFCPKLAELVLTVGTRWMMWILINHYIDRYFIIFVEILRTKYLSIVLIFHFIPRRESNPQSPASKKIIIPSNHIHFHGIAASPPLD